MINLKIYQSFISIQVTAASAGAPSDPAEAESKAKSEAKVDDSKPTTNIQVNILLPSCCLNP